MNRLRAAARDVVTSGRFVSAWSIAISLPVSLTVMAPQSTGAPGWSWLGATFAAWCCFAATLAIVGVFERRIADASARRLLVMLGVLAISASRPLLQDGWLTALGVEVAPPSQLPFRIATNVVVWAVVLTAVAIIVDALRSLRTANALLRSVIRELDLHDQRTARFEARARTALQDAADDVRRMSEALRRPDDAPDARALIDRLRRSSHALTVLEDADANDSVYAEAKPGVQPRPTLRDASARHSRIPLRLPPIGVVPALYVVCMLPYAIRAEPFAEILVGLAVVVVGGLFADVVPRRRAIRRRGSLSIVVFGLLSMGLGVAMTAIALTNGSPLGGALTPALVYPALAIVSAMCAGAIAALRAEQRRLSDTVARQQYSARADTRRTRDALREAGEVLHRDGQGRAVLFEMQHPDPLRVDRDAFAAELDALATRVAGVMSAASDAGGRSSIDALVETWGRVMDVRAGISAEARTALARHPSAACDAYDIVAEGLLNAVKHSGSRVVELEITVVATGSGRRLRVCVTSAGALVPGAELRALSHARALGARLVASDDGTRLEAAITLDDGAPVVSAEHPGGADIRRS